MSTPIDGRSFADVLLSGGSAVATDAHRQALLIEKLVNDDTWHVPTPFVRDTGNSREGDNFLGWRSYPLGGNPGVVPVLGRGAVNASADLPAALGFFVNGAVAPFDIGADPAGVSVPLGFGSASVPLFDRSPAYTRPLEGSSPAFGHLGWSSASFGPASAPGGCWPWTR